jgi:hypothetical protein
MVIIRLLDIAAANKLDHTIRREYKHCFISQERRDILITYKRTKPRKLPG